MSLANKIQKEEVRVGMEYVEVEALIQAWRSRLVNLVHKFTPEASEKGMLLARVSISNKDKELFSFVATVHNKIDTLQMRVGELPEAMPKEIYMSTQVEDVKIAIDMASGMLEGDDKENQDLLEVYRKVVDRYVKFSSYDWLAKGYKGGVPPAVFASYFNSVCPKRRIVKKGVKYMAKDGVAAKYILQIGDEEVSNEFLGFYPRYIKDISLTTKAEADVRVTPWNFVQAILTYSFYDLKKSAEPLQKEILKQLLH
jgi:hypothetical protein